METLELTQEELEIIRERRKTYDVEKVKAEEKITKSIQKEVNSNKERIFESIQTNRKQLKSNRELVRELNEQAGETLFRLEVTRNRRIKQVRRYYYTDENGVRHSISYKSSYSDNDQKYGPEVIEWEKEYTELRSKVVHVKYPFVYLSEDTYTRREGRYFNISGFGYDIERRSLKRLSSIVDRVKKLVESKRSHLDNRAFREECQQEFRKTITSYLDQVGIQDRSIYDSSVGFNLDNGIEVRVKLVIDYESREWTTKVENVYYPLVNLSENKTLQEVVGKCRNWKPLKFD